MKLSILLSLLLTPFVLHAQSGIVSGGGQAKSDTTRSSMSFVTDQTDFVFIHSEGFKLPVGLPPQEACCHLHNFEDMRVEKDGGTGSIIGTLKGLSEGDTATVSIQKSSEGLMFRILGGTGVDLEFAFDNIANGKWALSVDAKGYIFPSAKVLEISNNTLHNVIELTKAPEDSNFVYSWQDDESYVGHALQPYINERVEVEVLGVVEPIPAYFSAVNLYRQYGFFLSDSEENWISEEAYRLFMTVSTLNFNQFGVGRPERVVARWTITDDYIDKDIEFYQEDGVDVVRISRAAFTYANPMVVTVDGVKGRFFSKRLFNAIVYYYTDKGTDNCRINEIAQQRYGFEFLQPGPFLAELMGEHYSNFQDFTAEEKIIILTMFEEYPQAMHRQTGLKYLVRRINGQQHPLIPTAPAIAWVTNNNIEFMEIAFKGVPIEYMQRLVLHEKAHFLWHHTFDQQTKDDWADVGGWFLDPTSATGWTTWNTTEFVSAYAHSENPDEDMAESIAYYITNPEALRSRSIRKFEFIRDRIMNGTRYISVIRPDLTFEVYNLFPDYYYPGKIIRTHLEVAGGALEDKKVTLEIELNVMENAFQGASYGRTRFVGPTGTMHDMWLSPVNDEGSILRGEIHLSKHVKSGYWIVPQIELVDAVGNSRYENNSSYGIKCFINNPLEDVLAPYYVQNSLVLEKTTGHFSELSGILDPDHGIEMQALKMEFQVEEDNYLEIVMARIIFPTLDDIDQYDTPPYSRDIWSHQDYIQNNYPDSIKTVKLYLPVPDYFPSGYYAFNWLQMQDQALNRRSVYFDLDLDNQNDFLPDSFNQRTLRDSVYFETPYPDYKPPVLDLNDIQISARPTNPEAPNGETIFEMWLWIKDESDYPEHASGFSHGGFTLRDPQGMEHVFGFSPGYHCVIPDSTIYDYQRFHVAVILPPGSPPGIWGVSSIHLYDKAGNRQYYSFVEYVRFDVEQSVELQVDPVVEILGKRVNANNVDSVSVLIGAEGIKDQFYRLRMYSSMGGQSLVFEGQMEADTIVLHGLDLRGVNDGVLYATVFILDAEQALIGTGLATYDKDTERPQGYYLQANISNFGVSNLDDLIVDIITTEVSGSYLLMISQHTINEYQNKASPDTLILQGTFSAGEFQVGNIPLENFADGLIKLELVIVDEAGNEGEPEVTYIYKDTRPPQLSLEAGHREGAQTTLLLQADEYISNSLDAEQLELTNAHVLEIEKTSDRHFEILVERQCNDTIFVKLAAEALLDTVGNGNVLYEDMLLDIIVPPRPDITWDGSGFEATQGMKAYAWYVNAEPIEGADGAYFTPDFHAGNYQVVVFNEAGCNAWSEETELFTLHYQAGDHGSIQGEPAQLAILGQDSKPVEALPDVGYHFLEWSDGVEDNPRTDTEVTANLEVTAEFYVDETGLETLAEQVTVYPNPFNNTLTITNASGLRNVTLLNLFGQTVFEKEKVSTNEEVINTESLPPGVYFLRMTGTDDSHKVLKIMKK